MAHTKISGPAIRKMFRRVFGEQPFDSKVRGISVSPTDRDEWLIFLVKRFAEIDRVYCKRLEPFVDEEGKPIVNFRLTVKPAESSLPHATRLLQNSEFFGLSVNAPDREGLWIEDPHARCNGELFAPVVRHQQLDEFVENVKSHQDRREERHLKRLANAKAKQSQLIASLQENESLHNVSFRIGRSAHESHMSMRVRGKKAGYDFSFATGRQDEVSVNITDVIETLETLSDLGISFRTNNYRWQDQQGDWIEPDRGELEE